MKYGIVKFWVCKKCQKEYLDRPIVCSKCEGMEFELKYGGQVVDSEELANLVESYKYDSLDREKAAAVEKFRSIEKSGKTNQDSNDIKDSKGRSRI